MMIYGDGKEFMLNSKANDATSDSARRAAEEIADRWFRDDLPERARVQSSTRIMLRMLSEEVIAKHFAATPADNDAVEVCRLLSTLDWCVGYELAGENQTILDRAQELALRVMGMSDPPSTAKGDPLDVPDQA